MVRLSLYSVKRLRIQNQLIQQLLGLTELNVNRKSYFFEIVMVQLIRYRKVTQNIYYENKIIVLKNNTNFYVNKISLLL